MFFNNLVSINFKNYHEIVNYFYTAVKTFYTPLKFFCRHMGISTQYICERVYNSLYTLLIIIHSKATLGFLKPV
jgi:hypothetical protein